jgi:hypothetical protein
MMRCRRGSRNDACTRGRLRMADLAATQAHRTLHGTHPRLGPPYARLRMVTRHASGRAPTHVTRPPSPPSTSPGRAYSRRPCVAATAPEDHAVGWPPCSRYWPTRALGATPPVTHGIASTSGTPTAATQQTGACQYSSHLPTAVPPMPEAPPSGLPRCTPPHLGLHRRKAVDTVAYAVPTVSSATAPPRSANHSQELRSRCQRRLRPNRLSGRTDLERSSTGSPHTTLNNGQEASTNRRTKSRDAAS